MKKLEPTKENLDKAQVTSLNPVTVLFIQDWGPGILAIESVLHPLLDCAGMIKYISDNNLQPGDIIG